MSEASNKIEKSCNRIKHDRNVCVCVCLVRPAGSGMWKANPEMFESTQLNGSTFLFLVDVALSATTSETCHSQSHQHEIFQSRNYVQSIHNVLGVWTRKKKANSLDLMS